ncbi:MAG: ClpXP protease specificity-enhancing factor SspB [Planktomarina sp.]|nr:ClpXP protease specificity-enhancing factor SspB [Planktomarina sp.]
MIDYGNMMHDAMRGLIQRLLQEIASTGKLPGEHHFFITFDTMHPEVEIANWLVDRYPDEMTIVVQHWFDNLKVTDSGFSITLNFGDNPEPLYIPFMALRTFVDPSVEFGLRFEHSDEEETSDSNAKTQPVAEAPMLENAEPSDKPKTEGQVVSLDSFRKQ